LRSPEIGPQYLDTENAQHNLRLCGTYPPAKYHIHTVHTPWPRTKAFSPQHLSLGSTNMG